MYKMITNIYKQQQIKLETIGINTWKKIQYKTGAVFDLQLRIFIPNAPVIGASTFVDESFSSIEKGQLSQIDQGILDPFLL